MRHWCCLFAELMRSAGLSVQGISVSDTWHMFYRRARPRVWYVTVLNIVCMISFLLFRCLMRDTLFFPCGWFRVWFAAYTLRDGAVPVSVSWHCRDSFVCLIRGALSFAQRQYRAWYATSVFTGGCCSCVWYVTYTLEAGAVFCVSDMAPLQLFSGKKPFFVCPPCAFYALFIALFLLLFFTGHIFYFLKG